MSPHHRHDRVCLITTTPASSRQATATRRRRRATVRCLCVHSHWRGPPDGC